MRPAVQRIGVLQLCFNLDSDGVKQQDEPSTHILLRGVFITFICLYFLKEPSCTFYSSFDNFRWA